MSMTKTEYAKAVGDYAEEHLTEEDILLLAQKYIHLHAKHGKREKRLNEMKAILKPWVAKHGTISTEKGKLVVENRHSERYNKDKIEILIEMKKIKRQVIASALEMSDSEALVVKPPDA